MAKKKSAKTASGPADFITLTNAISDKFCWGYIYSWRIERLQYTDWMEDVPEGKRAADWQQWIDYRQSLRDWHGCIERETPEQAKVFWDKNKEIEPESFLNNPFERVTLQDYRNMGSIAQSLQTMGVSDDDAIRVASEGQFATSADFHAEMARYTTPELIEAQAGYANEALKAYGLSMGLVLTPATQKASTEAEAQWQWFDPAVTTEQGQRILNQQNG